jgi:NitT/TauT family transport system permease protein
MSSANVTEQFDSQVGEALTGAPSQMQVAARPVAPLARKIAMRAGWAIVGFAVFVILWGAVVKVFHIPAVQVPTPAATWTAVRENFSVLVSNAEPTIEEALFGFLAAVIVGVPLGYLLARPGRLGSSLNAVTVAAQIFPKICIAPLFIIWFGLGLFPRALFVFILGFFPIALNSAAGFASVPNDVRDLGSILEFGPVARLRHLYIPWALPSMFTGLKLTASYILIAGIAAEFVGAESGLGILITQAQTNLNMALAFAGVAAVAIVGFVIYGFVVLLEALLIPWHISRRRQAS